MKLGFITSILDGWTYEQMMDFASGQGFECVEWHAGQKKKQKEDMRV